MNLSMMVGDRALNSYSMSGPNLKSDRLVLTKMLGTQNWLASVHDYHQPIPEATGLEGTTHGSQSTKWTINLKFKLDD